MSYFKGIPGNGEMNKIELHISTWITHTMLSEKIQVGKDSMIPFKVIKWAKMILHIA